MKPHRSLFLLVSILLLISVLLTGTVTFISQRRVAVENVEEKTEAGASVVAREVELTLKEFPAWEWLIRTWRDRSETLEIEYDMKFGEGTRTEEKAALLREHQPDFQIRYATEARVAALPEEDQNLYAEIAYAWLNTRVNEIKRINRIDYLFCVLTDEAYTEQFFLFSGADEGAVRGTEYEEVYPLGTVVSVADNAYQQEAMSGAVQKSAHLISSGKYADYYHCIGEIDGRYALIGMTYNLTGLTADADSQTWKATLWAVSYQVSLSVLFLAGIFLFVLTPLKTVQKNIRLYAETKDSAAVKENLKDISRGTTEIGLLSQDFMGMTGEIDQYVQRIQTITADRERLGAELELASRIQAKSLPSRFPPFPDRTEFDIYASMDPAKEVGGDFYDFYLVDDDHLALAIADVSGKGVPAALFMMISMILIHDAAEGESSPAGILAKLNRKICSRNPEEMFVSVWLGILEISTGKLTAANAGHEYPALKKADGSFELLRDRHGLVIGAMDGVPYRDYEIQMAPGDKLFVYTDGLPEATNGKQELMGEERMLAALRKGENGTPQDILETMNGEVRSFVGDAPQFDDLTMLCLLYKG